MGGGAERERVEVTCLAADGTLGAVGIVIVQGQAVAGHAHALGALGQRGAGGGGAGGGGKRGSGAVRGSRGGRGRGRGGRGGRKARGRLSWTRGRSDDGRGHGARGLQGSQDSKGVCSGAAGDEGGRLFRWYERRVQTSAVRGADASCTSAASGVWPVCGPSMIFLKKNAIFESGHSWALTRPSRRFASSSYPCRVSPVCDRPGLILPDLAAPVASWLPAPARSSLDPRSRRWRRRSPAPFLPRSLRCTRVVAALRTLRGVSNPALCASPSFQ